MENTPRYGYLDSIRAIAALCTLIGHWLHMYTDGRGFSDKITHSLDLIVCGNDGVSMFFVLSGLVLSLKYFQNRDREINYAGFMVSRFFRIYPVFLVMLVWYFIQAHRPEMHGDYVYRWIFTENHGFWAEASLIRNQSRYFGPGWTLNVEVMVAAIVPFLILLMRHRPRWFKYLTLLSLVWTSFYSSFIFHFMLGIWIAAHFDDIRNFDFKASRIYPYRWLIYLGIWALYAMRGLFHYIKPGGTYYYFADLGGITMFHYTGVGSALILLKVINSPTLQRWLSTMPLLFLGKISYGIYIVQWYFIFGLLAPRYQILKNKWYLTDLQTFLVIGALSIVFSIILSSILYYAVEQPFIKIGRKWAKRAEARFA